MQTVSAIRTSAAIAAVALYACSSPDSPKPDAGAQPGNGSVVSGIDMDNFDHGVRPQDDFYQHVNGKWLERTEIPADKSNYGSFTVLVDDSEKNLIAIIKELAAQEQQPGTDEYRIAAAFSSFMDEATVDAAGIAPVQPHRDDIMALKSHEEVARAFGRLSAHGLASPIANWVDQNHKDTTQYITYMQQSGLSLPDRDYYLKDEAKFVEIRAKHEAYIQALLTLAGYDEAAAKTATATIVGIERAFAESHWTRVQSRDRDKTYNRYTLAELNEKIPFPWQAYFEGMALPATESVVLRQPSFFEALAKTLPQTDIAAWQAYLDFKVIHSAAPYLSKDFVALHFDFTGKTLQGISEMRPRWKRAVSFVEGSVGDAVGRMYVARHFKPEAKERMVQLIENLRQAFSKAIDELPWMTEETKKEAHAKLASFRAKIGYPDKWRDYSALHLDPKDLFGNVIEANTFEHDRNMAKLGGPVDRDEWFMFPHTVNAYYNPPMNEIVFPAAILQPPFFNVDADDAINYGAIGAVIGHEFSHGFDDQGRKSDGKGNLRDWWTEKDAAEFKTRSTKLVDQYNRFEPLAGANVNGEFTLGENIGDLSGLAMAYKAYKLSLGDQAAPVLDGYTGDQRFFLGWGQIWRRKYREEELRRRLLTDPHAPSRARVVGILPNIDAFYDAFGISEQDKMFLAPEKRVKIW